MWTSISKRLSRGLWNYEDGCVLTAIEAMYDAAGRLMGQLRNQPRTFSGSFWHKGIYPHQIWLDGLYMALPFYLRYNKELGNGRDCDDIISQFENARRFLHDSRAHF